MMGCILGINIYRPGPPPMGAHRAGADGSPAVRPGVVTVAAVSPHQSVAVRAVDDHRPRVLVANEVFGLEQTPATLARWHAI